MVTIKGISGESNDYPITPDDHGKTVWDFVKDKCGLDANKDNTLIKDGPNGEDVKDREISKFDGKKLFITLKNVP